MYSELLLTALGAAVVRGQGAPPPPQTLSTTLSGVLPVLPTETPGPFTGVETNEGAIVYDGPANPSFQPVNGPALVQSNLPAATYVAVLPSTNFDDLTGSTIQGTITGISAQGGSGVTFTVNFTGFPAEAAYGPFVYHIHEFPVPANGNCSATVGHLDPTDRGEYYPCNVAAPDTCQAGDLAGKHGNITAPTFQASYADPYLSTDPSSQFFFGDKSIVIHSSNTTRLTCANFQQVGSSASNSTSGSGAAAGNGTSTGAAGSTGTGSSGGSASTGTSTGSSGTSGSSATPSSSVEPSTGVASSMTVYSGAAVAVVAGVFAMLML